MTRPLNPKTLLSHLLILTTLQLSTGALVAPLWAQAEAATETSFDGETIRSITFSGNRALPEDTLLYYLDLEQGEPFSRIRLDRNIHRLWERELIDDLTVEALAAEGGGVDLVIRVVERPLVRSIEYEGLKRISRTDIDDRLSRERITLAEGGPLNLGELHRIQSVIEELYAEKGYRFAQATYTLEPVGEGERRVVFTLDEGDRVRIGDIRFEGNTVFGEPRLRWEMKQTKESGPITRLFKKDIYNPAGLEEDLDKVRDLYRKAGYKNVVLGEPQITVSMENPQAATIEEQKRRLVVTIPVEEGNRWRFGEVKVEGNDIYKDEVLLRAFRYRPGEWLRQDSVDEGVEAIREIYQNTGYIQARVAPELVEVDDDTADVVVHVQENDQFRIGRIEFEGNTRTIDKVLRRELRVQEGSVLSLGALRNSLFKIRQLGYFELNEEEPVKFDFSEDENTVDLVLQGQEADRTELQFGAGYSEGLGYFGQFSLKTQNFLGRGEQVGVSLQAGAYTDYYELSYFVPWFLDKPQSIGVQAFSREVDYDLLEGQQEFDSITGGSVSYGRSLGLFQSLSMAYQYYDRDYQIQLTNSEGELISQSFQQEVSALQPTYVYNSVDNRFEPRVGTRFNATVEYAGGFLGGSEYYVKPTIGLNVYRPITDYPLATVAAFNIEGGIIDPFGGRQLQRINYFRLGGDTSIRGFDRYRLYARDENDELIFDSLGAPVGGDRYVQLNLEYHFLLGGPFRLIVFGDAGNVYAPELYDADGELISPAQDFDLSRLRYSVGAELRITLPLLGGAPLRFIYAYNPDELPEDDFSAFSFSIGSTF